MPLALAVPVWQTRSLSGQVTQVGVASGYFLRHGLGQVTVRDSEFPKACQWAKREGRLEGPRKDARSGSRVNTGRVDMCLRFHGELAKKPGE